MFWGFLSSAFAAAVFGFGSEHSSLMIMGFLAIFIVVSAILFFFLKIDLRRHKYEA